MVQNFENDFNVSYENDSTTNYLVLKTGINNTLINYQVQMLLNNKLNGLLEFNVNYIKENVNCFYNVTSKCTLASFISRKRFSRDEFLITILNIINNIYQLKYYLLYENNIVLDENFIYVEPESIDIYFVYLPFLNRENDIKDFFIKLIFKLVKFQDEYSDNYIQKIIEVIKNDNFSLSCLKSIIERLLGEEIKNQPANSWTMDSSNNTEDKEFLHKRDELENGKVLQLNSVLKKNNMFNIDMLETSKFKSNKTKVDKTKAEKSKVDKTKDAITKQDNSVISMFKVEKAKPDKVKTVQDKVRTSAFKVDKINEDKAAITKGNFKIPNYQNIENQKHNDPISDMKTKDFVSEHKTESGKQNPKIKMLLFTIILFQAFLLITYILIVNSSFVKMSDNPMKTGIILFIIFLLVDVFVIRMINEKRNKTDETANYTPLRFINDMMKNKVKPSDAEFLNNSNYNQENHMPIVNENYNGETVIIKRPKLPEKPYLKEKDGEEVIEINKNSILIGRMENFVDFVINSSAIGKIHAEILQEGEDYFVMDCNSRNGTFINDNRIVPNTKNKIDSNDLLRFANKEFIFLRRLL